MKHLEAQEGTWRRATRLSEYLDAIRLRIETLPNGQARDEAEAWITWAAAHMEGLNQKPFLHGWSPYGPNSY